MTNTIQIGQGVEVEPFAIDKAKSEAAKMGHAASQVNFNEANPHWPKLQLQEDGTETVVESPEVEPKGNWVEVVKIEGKPDWRIVHINEILGATASQTNQTISSSGVQRLDIKEFRAFGYLQEANRRFFHPLGLALEVVQNPDGTERLGGVWDYRDDPEGMAFADEVMADEDTALKGVRVKNEWHKREELRKVVLGATIQPFPMPEDEGQSDG